EVEASRVETHALADQGHARRIALAPAQIDEPGLAAARTPYGAEHRIAGELATGEHLTAGPTAPGQIECRLGELFRPQVVGRGVDEIPRQRGSGRRGVRISDVGTARRHQHRPRRLWAVEP